MLKELKTEFVKGFRNVQNFDDLMEGLARSPGEGRFACVYGRAGRGKSRTILRWHGSHADTVYLRMLTVWRSSFRGFLQALCFELGDTSPPFFTAAAFKRAVELLQRQPRTVFLDEIEKLGRPFLEVVRDLADLTGCAVVLAGEEELRAIMSYERRVWSRTFEELEFQPLSPADIMLFSKAVADAPLSAAAAAIFHQASGGDLRIIKRDLSSALRLAHAKHANEISPEIAAAAVKAGKKGA